MERDGLIYTKTELATIGAQNETWWARGLAILDSHASSPSRYGVSTFVDAIRIAVTRA